jgi:3-phenylpropionate/trans-cinnamate dioxygenase ferredoxin subunit
MTAMTTPAPLVFPSALQAAGTADGPYERLARVDDLPPGAMRRLTFGDLDVLLAHTDHGIVAIEDRCPHMAAPLSAGQLDGCVIACPLHQGTFDLRDGSVVVFPTTGGLDADGNAHEPWSPPGSPPKPPPADSKALARSLTRVRRIRYLPLMIIDGDIAVRLPR